jgi:hypothetical protein
VSHLLESPGPRARLSVEKDREVEKAGKYRQEVNIGHPQFVRLDYEMAADEIAGGMMVCRLPRRHWRACAAG